MSAVDKSSAYPDTVQPGLPRLGKTPKGWTRTTLSQHLYEERRPVDLQDEATYDLVTVKRARGGVVKRETKRGADISVKTQFEVKSGDFLISKRQIVHGACGIVPNELDGATVSNEYSVLRSRGTLDLEYLKYLSHSVYFQQTCFHSSIGVHIEKMIFKLDRWLEWEFNLPPLDAQRRIVSVLKTWDQAIAQKHRLIQSSTLQYSALARILLTGTKRLRPFTDDWLKLPLKAICAIHYGASPKEIIEKNGQYPIIGTSGEIGRTNSYLHASPSVLIGRKGTIDNPILIQGPFWPIDTTFFCVPNADCDVIWLYHSLRTLNFAKYNEASGVPSLSRETLYAIGIDVPSVTEQVEIAKRLSIAERTIVCLESEARLLELEKSALIQQIFSGKRCLPRSQEAA